MPKLKDLGRLAVPVANGTVVMVEIDSIEYLASGGQTTNIHFTNGPHITGFKNLGYFEEKLSNLPFARVHHQCIVNISKIEKCSRDGVLVLQSGEKIEMSRRKAEVIYDLLYGKEDDATVQGIAFLVVDHDKRASDVLPIRPGRQLVGRQSSSGGCDLAITNGDGSLSRTHFFIEASPSPGGGHTFTACLHDGKKIAFIDKQLMKDGVQYPLRHNAVIKAGNTSMQFKTTLTDLG